MPLYMDVHIVPGVTAKDVAEAHRLDVLLQGEHNCKCMTYWIDEGRESIFCLIEAPEKNAVEQMHQRAHGLVPSKIIEVDASLVEAFLGRIYDPADAHINDQGLKIFHDPSFRVLLVARIKDPVLLENSLGEHAEELLARHRENVRKNAKEFNGSEVESEGNDFVLAFASAGKALQCAMAIKENTPEHDADRLCLSIGVSAGEPVEKSQRLFGDAIRFAEYMCRIAKNNRIAVTSAVKELVSKDYFQGREQRVLALSDQDEKMLADLFGSLEANWQDPDFGITEFCQAMRTSKSQLYRKSIELTGLSPNALVKDFRLEKAKELMKRKRYNISQITFDSGFTSPSYFTKCFKSKYGLLPMTYVDLLH